MKSKIGFALFIGLCIALLVGCSPQKNTSATRAYHELTTRYNVYFNAEEAYNEALRSTIESHKDNYHDLLPMYPNSSDPNDSTTKSPGGAFDITVEKTTKAIREHSISAKPRRNAAQPNTQEYRKWLRQNEFNPFIDQAWLLMGKAHVQNGDYTEAISVLSQTARLFNYDIDVVSEAQIWMLRAYTEMGWFSDAETVTTTLQSRSLPKELQAIFDEFYAFLLVRQGNYRDAIPHLIQSIGNQKNKSQQRRLQFLLGQLYANLGENENAYRAFEKLKGLNTPYEIVFNALMAQSQVSGGGKIISDLQRMAKMAKNEEYLDQIYCAAGNIYFSQNNVEKAIENYLLAEKNSTRNGIEKALAQIALGDIYFDQKEFLKAEPRYSEAVGVLPNNNESYPRVAFRADVLGEMSPHLSAVQEQDSLQQLAKLPEAEQLKIIEAHIAQLKKQKREETREKEIEAYVSQQQQQQQPSTFDLGQLHSIPTMPANRGAENLFYFYNPPLVAQGKNEFRRRWGNRALADNWRLQNVAPSLQETSTPSSVTTPSPSRATDPHSPETYLQQLPTTPEAREASDKIIENGLFAVGNIAKDRLEDFDYASENYNRHLIDFPKSEQRKEVYYQLYLIYLRTGNKSMAQNFKNKIIAEFPDSEYALAMSTNDYERTMQNYAQSQDSLYQQTYRVYLQGKPKAVQDNFEQAQKLFANSNLMPKFMLLNALSYIQTGEPKKLDTALQALVQKYPDGEESALAQHIITGLSEGKIPAANASPMSGGDWRNRFATASESESDTVRFDAEKEQPHSYLLLFANNSLKKSDLLFAVSDYNFTNFRLRSFPTAFVRVSPFEALRLTSFRSFDEASRYAEMLESDSIFRQNITSNITPLIISDTNWELLQTGKSLNEYTTFYDAELADAQPIKQLVRTDSIQPANSIKEPKIVSEPEKVIPSEEEKPVEPIIVPQQSERITIEQRQSELERKAEEALQQTDKTLSKKDREKMLKERERARKELLKQREQELKQKEKARKEELKRREKERRQKLKEQEKIRREKLKERERALRERGRA